MAPNTKSDVPPDIALERDVDQDMMNEFALNAEILGGRFRHLFPLGLDMWMLKNKL